MSRRVLRPYQTLLTQAIYGAWANGAKNVCAVLPTGGGKTVVFGAVIADYVGASVAIAHRNELVAQMSTALAREGVVHRIIGPDSLRRECVRLHTDELGRSFYSPNAKCAVAGVDTLVRMSTDDPWFNQVGLWVCDECFPAGTLVDGKAIETIRVGDYVTAFDEQSGDFVRSCVTHVFKNPEPDQLVELRTSGGASVRATLNHPFYTSFGWKDAGQLRAGDWVLLHAELPVRALRRDDLDYLGVAALPVPQNRENLLSKEVRLCCPRHGAFGDAEAASPSSAGDGVALQHLRDRDAPTLIQEANLPTFGPDLLLESLRLHPTLTDHGGHESQARLGAHVRPKPHEVRGDTRPSQSHAQRDGAPADRPGRQRTTPGASGTGFDRQPYGVGVHPAVPDTNSDAEGQWVPDLLQARYGDADPKNRHRSGRVVALRETQRAGFAQRSVSTWARLDSVEILELSDPRRHADGSGDGCVYNLEVDGLHTYIANGFVVHNCHHLLKPETNKWGRAVSMFPNARGLGVTATPIRADGKGLGAHADGILDVMVQGPTMRELINAGFLTEYRIFAPPSDIDLTCVATSASGDYSPPQLRSARRKSHITGDVVKHYLRIAPGKLGVTFDVDVESATTTAEEYRAAGVPAQVISGETPPLLRSDLLRQFRERKIHQIVSVDILGEGFDLPALEVVSFARPTQSYCVFAQQFGRALRILDGKKHAIIIDHVGNVLRHGLPDARREWSLDRRERRSTGPSDAIPVRTCLNPECLSVYERVHPCCPFCGHTPEPAQRSAPEFVDGDLGELDPTVLAHMRGDVHRVMADMPTLVPQNVSGVVLAGHRNRHIARRDAVHKLADTISLWAGWQKHLGRSDAESYRRFFYGFGTDMGTALTASAADAEALTTRILAELERANVVPL